MLKIKLDKNKSITARWLFNNFFVLMFIIIIIELSSIFAIQSYYYSSTGEFIKSKVSGLESVLRRYSQDPNSNFQTEIRKTVENFADKDKMELMVINSMGDVTLTSSGFAYPDGILMPDYESMTADEYSVRTFVNTQTNEKVMAVSYPISSIDVNYSAIRVVVSMTKTDAFISSLIFFITCACVGVLLMIAFSGYYFVGTIVKPLSQINAIAARYAKGDFAVRIKHSSEDEIGDLCKAINDMADELSHTERLKNEFISSVSHELRTPLTAIKGWAETLNEIDDDPITYQKGIRVIRSETKRLSVMVEELLDFSRMQSGKLSLQFENIDILAELGEAVIIYEEKAKREGITIEYDEPEMLPVVYGDKSRLKQVFINIIDNAVKYNKTGGKIIIKTTSDSKSVIIEVEDTGCGIKATDISKVKTKFFKANHTVRGSGIGLAVADELVAMHGGTLEVKSTENVGTAITITIPYLKEKSNA